jgi:hypothetical protein
MDNLFYICQNCNIIKRSELIKSLDLIVKGINFYIPTSNIYKYISSKMEFTDKQTIKQTIKYVFTLVTIVTNCHISI